MVEGPFGKIYRISRYRLFLWACGAMFVYFWFPDYLFTALSAFSWLSWIAPNNVSLSAMTGFNNGLGINPWSTFDWNVLSFNGADPLMVPFFTTANSFMGMFLSGFVIIGAWYTNAWNTAYLPINANHVYDNTGNLYNVSLAVNKQGLFNADRYHSYSPAYLSAANLVVYLFFFSVYPATIVVSRLVRSPGLGQRLPCHSMSS